VDTKTTTLREARRRVGLGRVKCAMLAGIDPPSLARYEAGRVQPGLVRALKIAKVLGVQADRVVEFLPALREAQDVGLALAVNGREEHCQKIS
jgi:transcriptional regulator with XRE-family HTH domain